MGISKQVIIDNIRNLSDRLYKGNLDTLDCDTDFFVVDTDDITIYFNPVRYSFEYTSDHTLVDGSGFDTLHSCIRDIINHGRHVDHTHTFIHGPLEVDLDGIKDHMISEVGRKQYIGKIKVYWVAPTERD